MSGNKISFTWKLNSFSYEWLCTETRFEKEAKGNSEMAYSVLHMFRYLCKRIHCKWTEGCPLVYKFQANATNVPQWDESRRNRAIASDASLRFLKTSWHDKNRLGVEWWTKSFIMQFLFTKLRSPFLRSKRWKDCPEGTSGYASKQTAYFKNDFIAFWTTQKRWTNG